MQIGKHDWSQTKSMGSQFILKGQFVCSIVFYSFEKFGQTLEYVVQHKFLINNVLLQQKPVKLSSIVCSRISIPQPSLMCT